MANRGDNHWLEISRDGLAKLVAGRPRGAVVAELIQNAWDEAVSRVEVEIGKTRDGFVSVLVTDDAPHGFDDLRHAYTVFAESAKKADPEKRGRFNLGEKLVLALSREASVVSTTGTIVFAPDGTRKHLPGTRPAGSAFSATLNVPAAEADAILEYLRLLLPPAGVSTFIGGVPLLRATPLAAATTALPTLIADDQGVMRATKRVTSVEAFVPTSGAAMLYEMGIPVCEIDLPWSLNVGQKVPLNSERDGVTAAYLRALCAFALNTLHDRLPEEAAAKAWVATALESPDIRAEAVVAAVATRFGENRVVFDPSDPEANVRAVNAGYALVHGGSFSREAWRAIREAKAIPPAGDVFPSHPSGPPGDTLLVPTRAMKQVASFTALLGARLLNRSIRAEFHSTLGAVRGAPPLAVYHDGTVLFGVNALGQPFFDEWSTGRYLPRLVSLVLHEFAHERSSNHLEEAFYMAIQEFSGRVTYLALSDPSFFTAAYHDHESED